MEIQWPEVVGFKQLIKVSCEKFGDDANMLAKNYKIFNPQQIFSVFDILFFDLH